MASKTVNKTEFGDWQTPADLAKRICSLVAERIKPDLVFEPNCGKGAFLRASLTSFPSAKRFLGLDINPDYVGVARTIGDSTSEIVHGDFFVYDWTRHLEESSGVILVIGNPPWVTNAELMRIGSTNVPRKSNINGLNGIDAITGKSNFDISESMLIKEIETLQGKDALLAMLCKTAIARRVVAFAWRHSLRFTECEIRPIDAQRHFDVSVDACVLIIRFHPDSDTNNCPCRVFDSLDAEKPTHTLGLRKGRLVSSVDTVDRYSELIAEKEDAFIWRSGIKHDCSPVMELNTLADGRLINGFEEIVDIEDSLLFPLLKSSDLSNGKTDSIRRFMLIPQQRVGNDTDSLESTEFLHSPASCFR